MKSPTLWCALLVAGFAATINTAQARNEFAASRISVGVQLVDIAGRPLAAPPPIGGQGFLQITVTPREADEGRVPVSIEVEDAIELGELRGFRSATVRRLYTQNETNVVSSGELFFRTSAPETLIVPITVRGGGLSTIRVRAESLREGLSVYARLAMTLDERASSWGFTLPPRETFEVHTLDFGGSCVGSAGVYGYAKYKDPNGNPQPVKRGLAKLSVKPDDDDAKYEPVAEMVTEDDGKFYFCDINATGIMKIEIFAEYLTSQNRGYRVTKDGKAAFSMTGCNCPTPSGNETKFLDDVFPDIKQTNTAFYIFDVAGQAWDKLQSNDCWGFDEYDQCRQINILHSQLGEDVYFSPEEGNPHNDLIFMEGEIANYPDAIIHEIAHALKYRLYDDTGAQVCAGHSWHIPNTPHCAWEEGFAGWLPTFVSGKDTFSQKQLLPPQVHTWSVEKPSWKWKDEQDKQWPHGDNVEGRVTTTLRDLTDDVNSLDNEKLTPWDDFKAGHVRNRIFKAMQKEKPASLKDFIEALYAHMSGLDDYDTPEKKENLEVKLLAGCFQNTIDYEFRNPLATKPMSFPSPWTGDDGPFGPEVPHAYVFEPEFAWNVISVRSKTPKTLRLYKDKLLTDPIGDIAETCPVPPAEFFPNPCGEVMFNALQVGGIVTEKRYAEVKGDALWEADADPYTVEFSGGDWTEPGSKTFPKDDRLVRVVSLFTLEPDKLTSVMVEPLEGQLLSIALLPADADAISSHDPEVVWSYSEEPDTRPMIRFIPNAPGGRSYGLVVVSEKAGSFTVHLDQKSPRPFVPALGFFQGSQYAEPNPDFGIFAQVDLPKTKLGYQKHVWSATPDLTTWAQSPWESLMNGHTYVEEDIDVFGAETTARLRPAKVQFGLPEFKSTLKDTPGGSSKPLCMRIMSDAGLKNEACTTVQFPIDFTKYWFVEWSKNF